MELQALKTSKVNLKFSGFISSNTTVKIDFNILPGSRAPGYFAAIWQGALVQSFYAAIQIHQIKPHQPSGTLKFNSLQLGKQDYIIGFGFSSNMEISICRTLYIPATPYPFQTLLSTSNNVMTPNQKDQLFSDQNMNLFMSGNFNYHSMQYLGKKIRSPHISAALKRLPPAFLKVASPEKIENEFP